MRPQSTHVSCLPSATSRQEGLVADNTPVAPRVTATDESRNVMAVLRESSFRNLEPTQAAELSLLLDLEAGWQNLLETASPAPRGTAALQDLRGKQKAYEAFRDKLVAYNARYSPGHVPQAHLPSLA